MTYSIGIDAHKKTSHLNVRDSERKVQLLDRSIRSWPRRFQEVLEPYVPAKVLIEASTMSRWVAPCLRKLGHEVIVGDPNFPLMYAARSLICKNDRNDARALAFALENGHYHAVYEPNAEQRPIAELLGTRTSQVRRRTAAINRVLALYAARGEELPTGEADTFWSRVKHLPWETRVPGGEPLLDELAMLEDLIGASEKKLNEIAETHPVARRLMTVPGVGPIVALSFYVKIGDPARFRIARQVESYLGLVPTIHASAQAGQGYRISKRGSSEVRTLLVQAAWSHVGSNDPKARPIKEWFLRLAEERGAGRAITAVARRLAGILFAIWRDGSVFELREPKPDTDILEPRQARRARRYQLNASRPPAAA